MRGLAPAIRLLLVALPLNFAWEMLQAPVFTGLPADWLAATVVCAQAAVGDGMIAFALFGLGVVAFRDHRWFAPPRLGRYAALVLAGIGVQVAVERVMVHGLDRWGYSSRQPVIPVLDVGLLPVLQAVVLLPLTFWVLALTEAR